ncbi:IST1-like protein [Cucumis melo var. makuwa]|nr:IST1-like protein [Cucumis melo var. makuwa]TYK18453.1 IST1-like protein [Cucumis melo var. makuwa]
MSMLNSFFNKGFKAAQCKTLLKLTIPRIKLLRNRREIQLKQMRRDIAKLLETGQEATARIRVEHIIREENMMAAQEILELFCELIVVRLPIIETQR